MHALRFVGDAMGVLLMASVVPVAILVVGAPIALTARLILWALGLL